MDSDSNIGEKRDENGGTVSRQSGTNYKLNDDISNNDKMSDDNNSAKNGSVNYENIGTNLFTNNNDHNHSNPNT